MLKITNNNLLEDLAHTVQVHSHGELSVASELVEAVVSERDGDQRHVGVVHGLELDAAVGTVPGGLLQQVLDGLQHLLQQTSLDQAGLKHCELMWNKFSVRIKPTLKWHFLKYITQPRDIVVVCSTVKVRVRHLNVMKQNKRRFPQYNIHMVFFILIIFSIFDLFSLS